jgi:hypothetical protein
MNVAHELLELSRIGVVAREQDDAANARIAEQLSILDRELEAAEIHHQGTE